MKHYDKETYSVKVYFQSEWECVDLCSYLDVYFRWCLLVQLSWWYFSIHMWIGSILNWKFNSFKVVGHNTIKNRRKKKPVVLVTRDNTHQNAMISVYLTEKYRLTKRQIKRNGMGSRIVLVCERVCVCVCECECVLMWQWLWYMCIPFGVHLANVCLIKIYEIQQVSRIK